MTCSEISNQLFVGLFTIWLTAILFLLLPYRLPYVKINSGDIMTILSASQIRAVELEPYIDAEFQQVITKSVLTGKVMRLIRDAAIITE